MKGRLSVVKWQSPFARVTQHAKAGLLAVIWISIAAFSVGAQAEVLLYPVSERVYSPDLYISGLSGQPNEAIDIELNNSTVVQTRSNATGEFTVIVALTAGDNRIRALSAISADSSEFQSIQYAPARDEGQTEAQREVRSDIGAPVLDAINAQSDTNPATLTGSAAPGSTVSFFVNGRLTRSIVADESGVFSAWVPLQDGDNSIYAISATDAWQTVASNSVASSYTNTLEREWSGDISNTLVWTKGDGSPYILKGDLNVLENVTLWIQPGVEVLVNGNYRMSVSGYFKVAGLIENPVLFKPTAADCNGINSRRSDWPGIEVVAGASAALEHAEVHCAQNGIHFNGGDGSVRNSEFLNNAVGIRTVGAFAEARIAPEIAGNTIRGSWSGVAIYLNSDPQISGGNEITLNGWGLVVTGDGSVTNNPQPVVTGNNLYDNTYYDFYTSDFGDPENTTLDATGNWWGSTELWVIASSIYDKNDDSSSPLVNYGSYLDSLNGQPAGFFLSGSIDEDTVLPAGQHLLLESSVVEPGVTLTLEAGASLLADPDQKLQVAGTLLAQGTADSEVVFAPLSGTSTRGQWLGIEVIAGGSVDFNYTWVEGARFGLLFNGGQGRVRNSLFRFNNTGVDVRAGSNPLISAGNEITLNDWGILVIGDGSVANNPQPVVTGNNLYGNTQYDFYTSDFGDPENTALDATGNWWGSTEVWVIASSIYDRNDDSSSPLVHYGSYLDSLNGQPAGLFLSGSIDEDTVLPAGHHLMLESSVVEPGVTLTLEAGASLRVGPDQKLQVAGTLLAQGTADSEVVFAPLSGTSTRGQWYGIEVIAGGSVDLDYARVEGAWLGLFFNGGQGRVRNSLFRFNTYGIYVDAGSNPLISAGNEITSNSYGLFVRGDGSVANNPQPVVTGNNLYGNTRYDFYTSDFGDPENTALDATGNWWGSTEPGVIASSIYDKNDDSSSPLVNYGGYLDSLNGQPAYNGLPLFGSIDEDTVLPAGRHLLLESSVVEPGVTLTLEAGASLLADADQKLQVAGTLLAQGTADSEVAFAPLSGTSTRGQWYGIEVVAGGSVDFNYARVEGARFGLEFNGGQGTVRHSLFRFNNTGVSVRAGSNPLISAGNEITLNSWGLVVTGDGSAANDPRPVATGNNLYNNTYYDFYTTHFGDPENTTLDATGNWWGSTEPAVIASSIYDRNDNSSSPLVNYGGYLDSFNGQPAYNGLPLSGSIDEDTVLPAGRYLLLENSVVEPGVTLTLEAGASLLADPDQKLQVAGTLLAQGTVDSEVVFAPLSGTSARGQWYGIEVIAGGSVDFNYARVEGAEYGLHFNGGQGRVRNSLFRFNTYGIYVDAGSNPLIGDGNEITSNDYGLFVRGDGSAANNPQPVVTGNNLYGNTQYDFYTTNFGDPENTTLDATGNWWGTVDEAVIGTQIYTATSTSPQVDFSNYWVGAFGRTVVHLTVAKFYPLKGEQALGSFTLSRAANVTIEIRRDVDNTLVYQADESYPQAGEYPIFWNGRDNENTLQAEGLYYVMLRVNNGLDDFVYNVPQPGGEGSVSGSMPNRYNTYANDFYKISVNVASPSLVSMQVTPDGESAFYAFEDVFYSKGQHWLYWDGRDPSGRIVESPVSIYYPVPKSLRSTAIYLAGTAPLISGAAVAPNIEVKSDPYLVSHSYEQLTRMAYRISNDAHVTFSLLPPGIVDPQDPSAIVLVDDVLQQAQDGSGEPIQHEVEWRGYDLADPNAVLVGEEGAYTFAIQARSTETGESTLYRGVVNLYR
ncbi:right-handed parallel beta-helix repeat-containing protein [Microbulbifer sp. TYP-18]|uniref:right-handed parallel beta-helix repeat-containing protein n=1 Tax=Microbulbifer sp. TYP-18 TaxID=3230024 RepID=UPI0034C5D16B